MAKDDERAALPPLNWFEAVDHDTGLAFAIAHEDAHMQRVNQLKMPDNTEGVLIVTKSGQNIVHDTFQNVMRDIAGDLTVDGHTVAIPPLEKTPGAPERRVKRT